MFWHSAANPDLRIDRNQTRARTQSQRKNEIHEVLFTVSPASFHHTVCKVLCNAAALSHFRWKIRQDWNKLWLLDDSTFWPDFKLESGILIFSFWDWYAASVLERQFLWLSFFSMTVGNDFSLQRENIFKPNQRRNLDWFYLSEWSARSMVELGFQKSIWAWNITHSEQKW